MNGGWPRGVHCVQPGGGLVVAAVLTIGRMRRAWLRRVRPGYVAAMQRQRTRQCDGCTHDVVDGRDLVWVRNVCGVRLPAPHTISPFRDRLGLVRLARPELCVALAISAALGALALALAPGLLPFAAAPAAFGAWFCRDPHRLPPRGDGVALAPADGVLDDVRLEASCPFFAGPAWRLGVYLGLLDVHVQRAPVDGVVQRCEHRPGRRVPTVRRGVTDANEQVVTWLRTRDGDDVVVRQVAGPLARRVCNVLASGDVVAPGDRFGPNKHGWRCELWLTARAATR